MVPGDKAGKKRMMKWVWVSLIIALFMLVNLTFENIDKNGGHLYVTAPSEGDQTLQLYWSGDIGPPMIKQINKAVKDTPETITNIHLKLDSGGGLVGYGGRVIQLLHAIQRDFKLTTEVSSGAHCLSMCVPIYLAAEDRIASPASRWMFHEVSQRDLITRKRLKMDQDEKTLATKEVVVRYFLPAKVNPQWAQHMLKKIHGADYWRSGKQLKLEKSGIIHQLN